MVLQNVTGQDANRMDLQVSFVGLFQNSRDHPSYRDFFRENIRHPIGLGGFPENFQTPDARSLRTPKRRQVQRFQSWDDGMMG